MKIVLFIFSLILNYVSSLHFDLSTDTPRCYIEELHKGGVAVIKYKTWSTPNSVEKLISVSSESGEIFQLETVKALKGKFTFVSKSESTYKICVEKTNIYWADRDAIFFQIKIMSDNMDEPDIKQAIKTEDLNPVKEKVGKIIKRGERLIKDQENELDMEDKEAKRQMDFISFYYSLAVMQILVVIGLGTYQIYSFRKFLIDRDGSLIL